MVEIAVPQIEIQDLSKTFKRRRGAGDVKPIDNISLSVAPGNFLVLLGPSGCGKTTLLRSVAGLEQPDHGRIRIEGQDVFDSSSGLFLSPNMRPISMIFQSYALWPHMTVFQNVAYPVTARRKQIGKAKVAEAVERALDRVGLRSLHDQYPGQLSGGQQQRVALARALVTDAKVLLFDEPLSNVDAKVREELRVQLIEMQRELGFTALYVTHDQDEAMDLADQVAVLNSGRIEQLAPPREVYAKPATRYVAEFVGTANLIGGTAAWAQGGAASVNSSLGTIAASSTADDVLTDDDVTAMFRPEDVRVREPGTTGENHWAGTVIRTSFFGGTQSLTLSIGGVRVTAALPPEETGLRSGDDVVVFVAPERVRILTENGSGS